MNKSAILSANYFNYQPMSNAIYFLPFHFPGSINLIFISTNPFKSREEVLSDNICFFDINYL